MHAGLFEPGAEDGFAAGFDDAGADEHAVFAVVGVAHAVGVGFEVGDGLVDGVGFRAEDVVEAGGGGEGFDVAVVQVGEPGSASQAAGSGTMNSSRSASSCRCSRAW